MTAGANPPIAIGNGAGFWGDNLDAPYLLARDGKLDVLTLEYLAELTLAILSHQRAKDPAAGFVTDFPDTLDGLVPILHQQETLRIVTNAGGLNPRSCAVECGKLLDRAGLGELEIGIVTGDDVLKEIPEWLKSGVALDHLETGEPLSKVADRLQSANVYLGARPIADALGGGARIVLTGRVADASLTLGPAAAHHGWAWDDWDRLAGASAAGHLIECGAQVTGGLWHEWDQLPDLAGIGYPDRRGRRRRLVGDHQARGNRGTGQRGDGHRATALRDRRPGAVSHARCRCRFHHGAVNRERAGPGRGPGCDRPTALGPAQAGDRLSRRLDRQRHAGRGRP